jgi:hypothetical protein
MAEISVAQKSIRIGVKDIPFPDQTMSVNEAIKALSGIHPELTTAKVDKVENTAKGITYMASKSVGTHG